MIFICFLGTKIKLKEYEKSNQNKKIERKKEIWDLAGFFYHFPDIPLHKQ